MTLTKNSDNIKIEGHTGRWYVIGTGTVQGQKAFLLEHETHGDAAAGLIVDPQGKVLLDEVYDGFPLEEWN